MTYRPKPHEIAGVEAVRKNREECGLTDVNHPGYHLEWGVYV